MDRPVRIGNDGHERDEAPAARPDPLSMTRLELGKWGEDVAADHLQAQGLAVLARRWRCREGEIDIVGCADNTTLVICEVKTRTGTAFGGPSEAVTRAKRIKLRRLALLFAQQWARGWVPIRFDVVSVLVGPGGVPLIDHRPAAF